MREAWLAEPRHSHHQGQPLEDLLVSMAAGSAASTLDLSDEEPYYPAPSSNPAGGVLFERGAPGPAAAAAAAQARLAASDMAGRGRAAGVRAADGLGGSHILPIYPGPSAAFAPVCTHVPTLQKGRKEGYEAVRRVLLPALERGPRSSR
jgi:hypothetical protein